MSLNKPQQHNPFCFLPPSVVVLATLIAAIFVLIAAINLFNTQHETPLLQVTDVDSLRSFKVQPDSTLNVLKYRSSTNE